MGRLRTTQGGLPGVPHLLRPVGPGHTIFLREVRNRYGRKPIWTDEEECYPEACRHLGLEHHDYTTEGKNLIERIN